MCLSVHFDTKKGNMEATFKIFQYPFSVWNGTDCLTEDTYGQEEDITTVPPLRACRCSTIKRIRMPEDIAEVLWYSHEDECDQSWEMLGRLQSGAFFSVFCRLLLHWIRRCRRHQRSPR